MEINEGFKVYKGLQRPLVFKNLKGKFIYWGAGGALLSFLLCVLIGNIFSVIYGLVALLITFVATMAFILYKQSQGLHNKECKAGTFIVRRIIRGKMDL